MSLDDVDILQRGLLLKKGICSSWSKFFSFRVDFLEIGDNKIVRVAPHESEPIYLKESLSYIIFVLYCYIGVRRMNYVSV